MVSTVVWLLRQDNRHIFSLSLPRSLNWHRRQNAGATLPDRLASHPEAIVILSVTSYFGSRVGFGSQISVSFLRGTKLQNMPLKRTIITLVILTWNLPPERGRGEGEGGIFANTTNDNHNSQRLTLILFSLSRCVGASFT